MPRRKRIKTTRRIAAQTSAEERIQGTQIDAAYYEALRNDPEAIEFARHHGGLFWQGHPRRAEAFATEEGCLMAAPCTPTAIGNRSGNLQEALESPTAVVAKSQGLLGTRCSAGPFDRPGQTKLKLW